MIAYNPKFEPPAPCLEVNLASLLNPRRRATLSALLDTGADTTAIPVSLINTLKLYPVGRLNFEDIKAEPYTVYTYAVRLKVQGLTIPRLEVVSTGLDFVVLGRDVLNDFYLLLNGPEQTFYMEQTPLKVK